MKYHKETVVCAKCGKPIRFPADGLNHGRMNRTLRASMYHMRCLPLRQQKSVLSGLLGRGGIRKMPWRFEGTYTREETTNG